MKNTNYIINITNAFLFKKEYDNNTKTLMDLIVIELREIYKDNPNFVQLVKKNASIKLTIKDDYQEDLEKELYNTIDRIIKKYKPTDRVFIKLIHQVCDDSTEFDLLESYKDFNQFFNKLNLFAQNIGKAKKSDLLFKFIYMFNINDPIDEINIVDKFRNLLIYHNYVSFTSTIKAFRLDDLRGKFSNGFERVEGTSLVILDYKNSVDIAQDIRQLEEFLKVQTSLIIPIVFYSLDKENEFECITNEYSKSFNVKSSMIHKLSDSDILLYLNKLLKDKNYTIDVGASNKLIDILKKKDTTNFTKMTKEIDSIILNKLDNNDISNEININDVLVIDQVLSKENPLDELVGLNKLKETLYSIVCAKRFSKTNRCMHMIFTGNPGTGKTTAARLVSKYLFNEGVLKTNKFIEKNARELCGSHIGETRMLVQEICEEALDGVLFIDEAYGLTLSDSPRDYGLEVLSTLMTIMENSRDRLVVIFAGYTDEMNSMIKKNPGLRSRVPYVIEFENPTRDDLFDMFKNEMSKMGEVDGNVYRLSKKYFDNLKDSFIKDKNFGNGRFVRNLVEKTFNRAALRTFTNKEDSFIIKDNDLYDIITTKEFNQEKEVNFGF